MEGILQLTWNHSVLQRARSRCIGTSCRTHGASWTRSAAHWKLFGMMTMGAAAGATDTRRRIQMDSGHFTRKSRNIAINESGFCDLLVLLSFNRPKIAWFFLALWLRKLSMIASAMNMILILYLVPGLSLVSFQSLTSYRILWPQATKTQTGK